MKLRFGTAGLRGIMQDGDGYMNKEAIQAATKGLALYLNRKASGNEERASWELNGNRKPEETDVTEKRAFGEMTGSAGKKDGKMRPSCVVSYDSRNNSKEFAAETARVLSEAGVDAWLFPELMPVPVLSFAIRELQADAGVMITASHNSKEYNGYKVYNATGGQILDEEASSIEAAIREVETHFSGSDRADASCGGNAEYPKETDAAGHEDTFVGDKGMVTFVPDSVFSAYKKAVLEVIGKLPACPFVPVLYTPLNGSGRKPASVLFDALGIPYTYVEEQWEPDGNFPTTPQPNPEKESIYELALRKAAEINCEGKDGRGNRPAPIELILANDPDADRVGAMVLHDGKYRLLSGNEIGTLVTYYLCEVRKAAGKGFGDTLVCSVVSTPQVDRIAAAYGLRVIRTLVGFKYIGEQMTLLGERFFYGFEESNGGLAGLYARDKDGVLGDLLLIYAASYFRSFGKTLVDVLGEIDARFGGLLNETLSLEVSSAEERNRIMRTLRSPDGSADERPAVKDYLPGIDGLPKADMLEMKYPDGSRVLVRPSGTEPKIKLYVSASSEERVSALEKEYREKMGL